MIINKKFLAQYSPLPINYDFSEIMNYVPIAEEIWIKPILGEQFMDELEEQVANNTVSDENATLLTKGGLYRYLAYATCLEGLSFIWVHFSQTGISLGKSDNSDSITLKDLTYVESALRRQVEFLKDSVIKWLDEHYEVFPLYTPINCGNCCCSGKGLNPPNSLYELYSTPRKCTDLR